MRTAVSMRTGNLESLCRVPTPSDDSALDSHCGRSRRLTDPIFSQARSHALQRTLWLARQGCLSTSHISLFCMRSYVYKIHGLKNN